MYIIGELEDKDGWMVVGAAGQGRQMITEGEEAEGERASWCWPRVDSFLELMKSNRKESSSGTKSRVQPKLLA